MAKRRRGKTSGYFRELFKQNPAWLHSKSNDDVVDRWKADHPGREINAKIRQSMINVKSIGPLRDRYRISFSKIAATEPGIPGRLQPARTIPRSPGDSASAGASPRFSPWN